MTLIEQYGLPRLSAEDYGQLSIASMSDQLAWEARLRSVLLSLFTKFRRTFLFIDGLEDVIRSNYVKHMVEFLQEILEQDFGNISMAIFGRPVPWLEPLLQHADVSIRLAKLEPDLSEYIHFKVNRKVKPVLAEANLDHDDDALAVIERIMAEASAGL